MLNTIGSMCGPLVAGFLFIPIFGKEWGLKAVAGLQLLTCFLVISALLWKRRFKLSQLGWIAAPMLAGLVLCFFYPAWSHRLLSVSKYQDFEKIRSTLSGSGWLESFYMGRTSWREPKRANWFLRRGGRRLHDGGKIQRCHGQHQLCHGEQRKTDASSRNDMQTQTLLGHFRCCAMTVRRRSWSSAWPAVLPRVKCCTTLSKGWTSSKSTTGGCGQPPVCPLEQPRAFRPQNPPDHSGRAGTPAAHRSDLRRDHFRAVQPLDGRSGGAFHPGVFRTGPGPADGGRRVRAVDACVPDGLGTFSLVGRTFAEVFPNNLLAIMTLPSPTATIMLVGFKGKSALAPNGRAADRVCPTIR